MATCLERGCPTIVDSGRCAQHETKRANGWNNDAARIRGRKLQSLRTQLFAREPLCRECVKSGRYTLATIRDHIVPMFEGGTDEDSNIQPLCQLCSDMKTAEESQRGHSHARARW